MTPEERLTKIENSIQALIENQARHEVLIDKQNAGIRDLIVVSRAVVDAQKHTDGNLNALIDTAATLFQSQKKTDEALRGLIDTVREHEGKIEALIETVDRIIRKDNRQS